MFWLGGKNENIFSPYITFLSFFLGLFIWFLNLLAFLMHQPVDFSLRNKSLLDLIQEVQQAKAVFILVGSNSVALTAFSLVL